MSAPTSPADRHNSTLSTPDANLSAVRQRVVAALAQGRTITAAAAEVQLHRSTIHNWLNTIPAFRAALTNARAEYAAQLRDEMKELSATALETLRTLLSDPKTSSAVRMRTSLAILERRDWSLPADAERNLDREIKEQLLALGSHPTRL
jgi:uncharacterized heparinase superfamily protein